MDVIGYISFLADSPLWKTEKPFGLTLPADYEPPKDARLTNLLFDERRLSIRDMRARMEDFVIDQSGFTLLQQPTRHLEIDNMTVFEEYKKETEEILGRLLQPDFIRCWDGRIRKAERLLQNIQVEDLNDKLTGSNPVNLAHVDETVAMGHESIELVLSEEEKAKYMNDGYRVRMVNTWRPMVEDLEHFPLAMLDFRSIDPMQDFVPYDQVSPIRHKELYLIKPKEEHQWYWASQQKRSELLVFVQYDSMVGSQARFCPHAGFRNTCAGPNATMRKSIETRSVVITKIRSV
ncbi:unnamed protein product [Alternaria alternata]